MKTMKLALVRCGVVVAAMTLVACDRTSPADSPAPAPTASRDSAAPAADALRAALGEPDAFARAERLAALLAALGPESAADIEPALSEFLLDLRGVEVEMLLRFWASHEPASALAWARRRAFPMYRASGSRVVIEVWAEADPPSAVAAVESLLPVSTDEIGRAALLALVRGWFETDRPGLEAYIQGLGSGIKRQRALFAYALALVADGGGDSAIRWAESVPEDDRRYKLEVFRQVMSALASADMSAALRMCDAHCNGDFGKGLRIVLVRTRLREGEYGGDVVEWVAAAPKGDVEQQETWRHTLWVAYSTWVFRQRDEALAWMDEKTSASPEPESWIKLLYGEYARQIAQDSPERALEWAARVEDDVDRKRTQIRIARYWYKQDPEAAEAWLSQSSLSEEERVAARNAKQPDYIPTGR
jgi:hypothetical protein